MKEKALLKQGGSDVFERTNNRVMSLERSLYGVVVMTSCLALLLAYLAFVVNDLYTFRNNLANYMSILAEVTARNSVGAVSFSDDDAARDVLHTLRAYPNIRHAVVLSTQGKHFVEFRYNWLAQSRARIVASDLQFSDGFLELSRPIVLDKTVVGYVYLLVELSEQKARLYRFIGIGAGILLLALLGALFLSRRLIRAISEPIFSLVALADSVGRDKNYLVKAKSSHIIELNNLVLSINEMLEEIHHRDNVLLENEKQLRLLANHDPLTQLPNRSMFMDQLKRAVQSASRRNKMMAVLFIDLDRFKQVNDTLGHKVGDELLRHVSGRLTVSTRETDTVARLAGDEFTIILEELKEGHDAEVIARKILEEMKKEFFISGSKISIGVSIGISIFPHDALEGEMLLHHADTAMYFSKNRGRNRFEFYDPKINEKVDRRNRIETDLRLAIGTNKLEIHYQPKVGANDFHILGFEALLRWQHPILGVISPDEFIAVAETSGLIKTLGEWVMREACKQLKQWHKMGYSYLTIAVNVSARQFHLTDFSIDVANILHEVELLPEFLEVELTESLVMDNPEKVILMLHALRNLGVKISIDDFGTGYSSLSYLQRFPINTLKVDRSFVNAIDKSDDGKAIASAIISMAHNLHLQVVAEGVETQEQLVFLQEHLCEQLQGYYFGRPQEAEKASILLKSFANNNNIHLSVGRGK